MVRFIVLSKGKSTHHQYIPLAIRLSNNFSHDYFSGNFLDSVLSYLQTFLRSDFPSRTPRLWKQGVQHHDVPCEAEVAAMLDTMLMNEIEGQASQRRRR